MQTSTPLTVNLATATTKGINGFTLVELLVVIAIASAMTGIVVTSMSKWLAGVQHRAEIAELHSAVQHALKMAVLRARELHVVADVGAFLIKPNAPDDMGVSLPPGWHVSSGGLLVTKSGFCAGGRVEFKSISTGAAVLVARGSCAVRLDGGV